MMRAIWLICWAIVLGLGRCLASHDDSVKTVRRANGSAVDDAVSSFIPAKHDKQFFTFISRPDIIYAPRLNVTIYDASALAPGFMFVGAYSSIDGWAKPMPSIGPYIYDQGELVWTGTSLFGGYPVHNFRVVVVDGKSMLSATDLVRNSTSLLDETYTVRSSNFTGGFKVFNMHDYQLVDGATRAIYLARSIRRTSKKNSKAVGYHGECNVDFGEFTELDFATGEKTFFWSSENHIGLNESVHYAGNATAECSLNAAWDAFHLNAVDKLPDGGFLLSARSTGAIYRISRKDGSILWRLGGKMSDFVFDSHFSGQHDVRHHFSNSTYMIISLMDNAMGPSVHDDKMITNNESRALIIGLDTRTMVATQLQHFDHPNGGYASRAGNLQLLPNGNAFAGWRQRSLMSEYTADGRLIMQASFGALLHSYRAFKFPWIGSPPEPPAVHSQLVRSQSADNKRTIVHVSWNGDTEVVKWNVYKTDETGETRTLASSAVRTGFGTMLTYYGHAQYVIVVGYDRAERALGESEVFQSVQPAIDSSHHHSTQINATGSVPSKVDPHQENGQEYSSTSKLDGWRFDTTKGNVTSSPDNEQNANTTDDQSISTHIRYLPWLSVFALGLLLSSVSILVWTARRRDWKWPIRASVEPILDIEDMEKQGLMKDG